MLTSPRRLAPLAEWQRPAGRQHTGANVMQTLAFWHSRFSNREKRSQKNFLTLRSVPAFGMQTLFALLSSNGGDRLLRHLPCRRADRGLPQRTDDSERASLFGVMFRSNLPLAHITKDA